MNVTVRIAEADYNGLIQHLFPGDEDEHGAVLGVGTVKTKRGIRLLVRRVFLAQDGVDYIPGDRGYRKLTEQFVAACLVKCGREKLGYIAVHCHSGSKKVRFSTTDMESHNRGYGALMSDLHKPVGALVFAQGAVAGDIWMPDGARYELSGFDVVGNTILHIEDGYRKHTRRPIQDVFDRQVRMFGDTGQQILSTQKVGVIGAGGVGAIVVEQLSRLGIGEIVVVDDDRIHKTNLNRLTGSRLSDVYPFRISRLIPALSSIWPFLPRRKVDIAKRFAKVSGSKSTITPVPLSIIRKDAAAALIDCDYLFLAADTAQARLVFNAIVNQYLIAGVETGVKIQVDKPSGQVVDISTWVRRIIPGEGCLWCNDLISPSALQEESLPAKQRRQQRYINIDDAPAPSIIMLNGIVASHAVDGYIERVTELSNADKLVWHWYEPQIEKWHIVNPAKRNTCPECGRDEKRFAMGDGVELPISNE